MHVLLALHLLKNLVSRGPLTAITESLDGAGKIYELKSYSDAKSADLNREVRRAADHMYWLLVDLSSLFGRRRCIAVAAAQQYAALSTTQKSWAEYLVRRLPMNTNAQSMHALFRPRGICGRVFYETPGAIPSSAASHHAPSVMALSRLEESLRESRFSMGESFRESKFDGYDEEDRLFGTGSQYLDGGIPEDNEDNYVAYLDSSPEEERSNSQPNDDGQEHENDRAAADSKLHGESQEEKYSFPTTSFNGGNILASFNSAVSSSGGISLPMSSNYGSERSNSPVPNARRIMPMTGVNEGFVSITGEEGDGHGDDAIVSSVGASFRSDNVQGKNLILELTSAVSADSF